MSSSSVWGIRFLELLISLFIVLKLTGYFSLVMGLGSITYMDYC